MRRLLTATGLTPYRWANTRSDGDEDVQGINDRILSMPLSPGIRTALCGISSRCVPGAVQDQASIDLQYRCCTEARSLPETGTQCGCLGAAPLLNSLNSNGIKKRNHLMYKGFVKCIRPHQGGSSLMSITLSLCRSQRRRIQRKLRKTQSRIEALRCRVLLLLHERFVVAEIAERVGCVRATVYRTLYRFEDLGEAGLEDRRRQREPTNVTAEVHDRLLGYLEHSPKGYGWHRASWTLELLALQLERDTAVTLSARYVSRLLRIGGCRRGRPRPALRIPVRGRRAVLERIEQLVAQSTPEAEVFYVDEADIDLNPRIGLSRWS